MAPLDGLVAAKLGDEIPGAHLVEVIVGTGVVRAHDQELRMVEDVSVIVV